MESWEKTKTRQSYTHVMTKNASVSYTWAFQRTNQPSDVSTQAHRYLTTFNYVRYQLELYGICLLFTIITVLSLNHYELSSSQELRNRGCIGCIIQMCVTSKNTAICASSFTLLFCIPSICRPSPQWTLSRLNTSGPHGLIFLVRLKSLDSCGNN